MLAKRVSIALLLFVASFALACDGGDKERDAAADASKSEDVERQNAEQPEAETDEAEAKGGDEESEREEEAEAEKERMEAESSGEGVVAEEPPLEIREFINPELVREYVEGSFEPAPLAGQAPSEDYNAIHFMPSSDEETFGVGLQMWRFESYEAALERLESLRRQHLIVEEPDPSYPVEDGGFVSERNDIYNLYFPIEGEGAHFVAGVSCGVYFCSDNTEAIVAFSEHVIERAQDIKEREPRDGADD